ncbi:MAG TPA: pyridoxal phosphate-dependent aminotransferase, partial [Candidatus Acidoferrales bacterium]|nr:pyridoxal phosphate-dependent aminotransferase [Candidatus Acidoferrales bacterium]
MFASRTNWPLETNRLTRALEEHRKKGRQIFDLTASNPTECGLEYPVQEILAALSDPRALAYCPDSKGLLEAREAVSGYYAGRVGFSASASLASPIDPERILLASGTSEAYTHIFRLLCEPGDEFLVPAPSYPLFQFLADLADIRLVPYPLIYDHGWQIDFASLRAALTSRSRGILVVHPNNPTGSFVKPHEAAELVEICAAREMAIVADEVFLDYGGRAKLASTELSRARLQAGISGAPDRPPEDGHLPKPTLVAAAPAALARTFAMCDGALTFTLSGLSKISLLPQMKLAWTVVSGPNDLAQTAVDRLEIIADTYLSPSTPVQLALPKFLSLRHKLQEQLQLRISTNLASLNAMLRESRSLTLLEREGGWYAILRVPVTATDDDLTVALLEHHSVLVHPGHFFNFSREGFLVLSLITAESEFQEGLRRLRNFF